MARTTSSGSRSKRGTSRTLRILALALAIDLVLVVAVLAWRPQWALGAYYGVQRMQAGAAVTRQPVGDTTVTQLVAGPPDAPVIVLLHGFTGTKENWLPLMAALSPRFRVIAPDLPGWGESTRLDGADYGSVAQAERVSAWLSALPQPPALVVGHSMGGHIAALLAAKHPDQVARLALVSAAGVPFKDNAFGRAVLDGGHPFAVDERASFKRFMALVFAHPPYVPWPIDRAMIDQRIANLGFEKSVLASLSGPERFAVEPLLGDIRAPTLLLWCDGDQVIDPSAAATYAAGLAQSRTVLLPGCGHMPMLEAVDDTANALAEAAVMPLAG